jgi:hypothetical protein
VADKVPAPAGPTDADERYGDVMSARRNAHISQPLGDESALDLLAMRDHILGLEAELVNAREEAAHWHGIAMALRKELGTSATVRALRGLRMARKYVILKSRARAADKAVR